MHVARGRVLYVGGVAVWGLGLIIGWAGIAHAGPFTHKTSQGEALGPHATRPLIMPKGWLEVGLRASTKASDQYRTSKGKLVSHDGAWRYSQVWLSLRQGFSKTVTLYADVPWVSAELSPAVGTTTRTIAMGDAHVGILMEPWSWETAGVGLQVDLKAPSGVEWPGGASGGPNQVESFLTGTGVTNVGAHLLARVDVAGRVGVRGSAGVVAKPPAVVGYVLQDDGFGNGWLDPGDEVRLEGTVVGQLHPLVAMTVGARWSRRGEYQMGVSGPGTTTRELSPLPGGTGQFTDGSVGLSWSVTQHWEVSAEASRSLAGTDTRTFAHLGLEEFSPQPGNTFGLGVVARW